MSNYPPGVTGFEPQIAGYDEIPATRTVGECWHVGDVIVTYRRSAWPKLHSADMRANRRVSAHVCTFTGGDVEGVLQSYQQETCFLWDCPSCGTENEHAITDDERPDMGDDGDFDDRD